MESANLSQKKSQIQNVCVIFNPATDPGGETEPLLRHMLKTHGGKWAIHRTQAKDDARKFAEQAHKDGCDLVIACGGDGTVTEVANGLHGTDTLMSILPNGTANVMAAELNIPLDKEANLHALLNAQYIERKVDMGLVDNVPFILRVGMGYEAEISVGASREEKSRLGRLSYFLTAWRKLRGLRPVEYRLTLDDELKVIKGITCMISNSMNIGIRNVELASITDVNDGLLDVTVIQNMHISTLFGLVQNILASIFVRKTEKNAPTHHFQASQITIESPKRQMIAIDGEPYKRGKRITIKVLPSAVKIAIPVNGNSH